MDKWLAVFGLYDELEQLQYRDHTYVYADDKATAVRKAWQWATPEMGDEGVSLDSITNYG